MTFTINICKRDFFLISFDHLYKQALMKRRRKRDAKQRTFSRQIYLKIEILLEIDFVGVAAGVDMRNYCDSTLSNSNSNNNNDGRTQKMLINFVLKCNGLSFET